MGHRAEEGTICVLGGISAVHYIANAHRRHRGTAKTVASELSKLNITWSYPDIERTTVSAEWRISSESGDFCKKKSTHILTMGTQHL